MAAPTVFLTGATGLVGGDVLAHLLRADPALLALVLVRDPDRWVATAARRRIPTERVVPLCGDVRAPGLGLDAAARARLERQVTLTVHLAADIVFSRSLAEARATNLEGTRNLLDLSAGWPGRLCLVSTAFVAGRRSGWIREEEHGDGAGWVNAYEQSKWEAEQLVRDSGREFLILRSSTIVCDSVAGEVSQINAVHRALRMFHAGLAPMIPGREESPVDLVSTDYVADAVARLALREEAAGTYHLCAGGGAIPLGELLDLTYEIWSRDPAWRRRSVSRPALTDLRTYGLFEETVQETADPRLRRITRSLSHFVPQLALEKRFDTTRAESALGGGAPAVRDYWARVVEHLLATRWLQAKRRAA